jgi:hypothetical protein
MPFTVEPRYHCFWNDYNLMLTLLQQDAFSCAISIFFAINNHFKISDASNLFTKEPWFTEIQSYDFVLIQTCSIKSLYLFQLKAGIKK